MNDAARILKGKSALLKAVIGGGSLNELIRLGESIIGFPFVLSTQSHFVWYASAEIPRNSLVPQTGGATVTMRFLESGDGLSFLEEGASPHIVTDGAYHYCFCAMRSVQMLRGYSVMIGGRPFSDSDVGLHSAFCDILSNELEKEEATKRVLLLSEDESLLMNILEDANYSYDHRDIDEMFPRKVKYMELIAISFQEVRSNYSPGLASIMAIREVLGCDICFSYRGSLVSLAPVGTAHQTRCDLEAFLRDNGMLAGVSYPLNQLGSLRTYYEQAKTAIAYCRREGRLVTNYLDCVFYDLYASLPGSIVMEPLCNYDIKNLQDYDKKHGTEYLNTLQTFIRSGYSAFSTAKQLNIHRNSVLARMEKLREIVLDADTFSIDGYFSSLLLEQSEQQAP